MNHFEPSYFQESDILMSFGKYSMWSFNIKQVSLIKVITHRDEPDEKYLLNLQLQPAL